MTATSKSSEIRDLRRIIDFKSLTKTSEVEEKCDAMKSTRKLQIRSKFERNHFFQLIWPLTYLVMHTEAQDFFLKCFHFFVNCIKWIRFMNKRAYSKEYQPYFLKIWDENSPSKSWTSVILSRNSLAKNKPKWKELLRSKIRLINTNKGRYPSYQIREITQFSQQQKYLIKALNSNFESCLTPCWNFGLNFFF